MNCATAEGDLRVLESEEAHIVQQVAEGASAITPAGLVVGILTRTEREKLRVATGAYDEAIDNRIEQIKLI